MPKSHPKIAHQISFRVILIAAVAAFAATIVLMYEKIRLSADPAAQLSCSFNFVLNCASVMETWQAGVFFSIPNMYVGLVAFPVLITAAVAALWGGARFNRKFMLAMNAGVLLGAIFSYWLFFSSLYVIEVLCPWCLIVTTSCTLLLAATTHVTLKENYLRFPAKTNAAVQKFLTNKYHQVIVAGWIVLMIALVFLKFGDALFAA